MPTSLGWINKHSERHSLRRCALKQISICLQISLAFFKPNERCNQISNLSTNSVFKDLNVELFCQFALLGLDLTVGILPILKSISGSTQVCVEPLLVINIVSVMTLKYLPMREINAAGSSVDNTRYYPNHKNTLLQLAV